MTDHSVLLLAYGQSNADLYPAEPAYPCAAFGDPRIVTFNDGNGFRGLIGKERRRATTNLVPAEVEGEAQKSTRGYQSFQLAAAARLLRERRDETLQHVIIRAEGQGGRPMLGYVTKDGRELDGILTRTDGSDSVILLNACESIRAAATLALRNGAPLSRVIVNFLHGEADRATSRDEYGLLLERLIKRFEMHLADLGLPIDWLILDPAGTDKFGSGNAWPCRQAMADVAARHLHVHLIGTGTPYPLDDTIHYASEARVLFGEHFGAAAAQLISQSEGSDAGFDWLLAAPRIAQVNLSGRFVDLELTGNHDFELVRGLSDTQQTVEGFSVLPASRCRVESVDQTGPRSLRVTLDRPPALQNRSVLNYAFQLNNRGVGHSGAGYPVGRGGWRSVDALESLVLPGRRIHQWVPGFSIAFQATEQG